MIRSFVLLIFALAQFNFSADSQSSAQAPPNGFRSAGEIRLTFSSNGVDGKLILLIDNRLPEEIPAWDYLDSVGDPSALQNAALIILGQDGDTIVTELLERPSAWFQITDSIPDSPTWMAITVDYSSGMGSYNGPITSFLGVKNAKIEWLEVSNVATNQRERIFLMRSLKTQWRLVQNDPPYLLQAACRPDFDKGLDSFKLIFTRDSLKGSGWFKSERVESGFLEFEDESDFPPESKFPE